MAEPSVRTSRLALAGAFLAVAVIGGAGFFAGRTTAPSPAPPAAPVPRIDVPPPVPTESGAALERGDILLLAHQAADAFASGAAVPENVTRAGGRRFDLVIPFGCSGPSDAASGRGMRWQYDAEQQTLRASAVPATWSAADWGLEGHDEAPAARGFWITRPWSSSGNCPANAGTPFPEGADAIALPGQTLAIVQFLADGHRSGWRGDRPFDVVQRMTADRFADRQWLRLRVKGRIDGGRQGGSVRCVQPGGMDQRPMCAVMVQMEEVRIELPESGTGPASSDVLGTWSVDQPR
ncbi:MAG: hypothetical protein AB7E60_04125 [Sphingobium sp.]